jgi:hypothetical protein
MGTQLNDCTRNKKKKAWMDELEKMIGINLETMNNYGYKI